MVSLSECNKFNLTRYITHHSREDTKDIKTFLYHQTCTNMPLNRHVHASSNKFQNSFLQDLKICEQ